MGQSCRADRPQAAPATLPTELCAACCVAYAAKTCPECHVTPRLALGWSELPKHKAIIVGRVCCSEDLGRADGAREAEPHQVVWGELDLEARAEGTDVPRMEVMWCHNPTGCGSHIPGVLGPGGCESSCDKSPRARPGACRGAGGVGLSLLGSWEAHPSGRTGE